MRAAQDIFARDGFEAARLEDIAREAGYTRGAFYANFECKADLFVALFQEEMARRGEMLQARVSDIQESRAKLDAIRDFYVELSRDRRWGLLILEYKLFAIRHPELKARLALLHSQHMASPLMRDLYDELGVRLPVSRIATRLSLGAFAHALNLEHVLDPVAVTEDDASLLLELFFDAVTRREEL